MISGRDLIVIEQMLKYCVEVEEALIFFNEDEHVFLNNSIFRNAVAMPVQQIGELANHLSADFKSEHDNIKWRFMIGMRNWFAHEYYKMDAETIWQTALYDIPEIKVFCEKVIKKAKEQESGNADII